MRAFTFMGSVLRAFPGLVIGAAALQFLSRFVEAIALLGLAPVVDLALRPGGKEVSGLTRRAIDILSSLGIVPTVGSVLVLYLAINILCSGLNILAIRAVLRIKYAVLRRFLLDAFDGLLRARYAFFVHRDRGMLLNALTRDLFVVGDGLSAMAAFFAGLLNILMYLLVPLYLSWQVTCVAVAAAGLLTWPFFLLGGFAYRLGRDNTETANRMTSVIHETLGAIKPILGFGNQTSALASLGRAFDAHCLVTVRAQTIRSGLPLLYVPVGISAVVVAMMVARHLSVPLAEIAVIVYALFRIVPVVAALTGHKSALDNFFPSYEQIQVVVSQAREQRQPSGSRPFVSLQRGIALENVAVAHGDGAPVLSGVDVDVPRGAVVALVGPSGAGKTSIIDVLLGFITPIEGQVLVDDVALSDLDLLSWRRRLGYVSQDSVLLHATVRQNLAWARTEATERDMWEALKLANAAEFVADLEAGLDTTVGDRGARLSGGQVQRIALARALLGRPEVLLLDEATSALDSESEQLIQQAVESLRGRTTIIIVAHRLSTVRSADAIYVLDRGTVVERGNYDALATGDGSFARMVAAQSLEPASAPGGGAVYLPPGGDTAPKVAAAAPSARCEGRPSAAREPSSPPSP